MLVAISWIAIGACVVAAWREARRSRAWSAAERARLRRELPSTPGDDREVAAWFDYGEALTELSREAKRRRAVPALLGRLALFVGSLSAVVSCVAVLRGNGAWLEVVAPAAAGGVGFAACLLAGRVVDKRTGELETARRTCIARLRRLG